MDFTLYWRSTPASDKLRIAHDCETSVGFLHNIAGKFRKPSAELAAAVERATHGAVMRWDMRPNDWHLVWPELRDDPRAPRIAHAA